MRLQCYNLRVCLMVQQDPEQQQLYECIHCMSTRLPNEECVNANNCIGDLRTPSSMALFLVNWVANAYSNASSAIEAHFDEDYRP